MIKSKDERVEEDESQIVKEVIKKLSPARVLGTNLGLESKVKH